MTGPDLTGKIALAILMLLPTTGPVRAQDGTAFVAPFNNVGSPAVPADKRIGADALGPLQAFRGRPWWHALAFCAGSYENQAYLAEEKGDAVRAEAIRDESNRRFFRPALLRVMDDRGIDNTKASGVVEPDINYQFLAAADTPRPFAADVARCRAIELRHASLDQPVAPRPAAPAAPAASTAPTAPVERRFKARADLTRGYDGEPYWRLLVRCAKGSQGVVGPRGEMMGRFAGTAVELLHKDRGVSFVDGQKLVMEALPAAQPIAPGPSEDRDSCIAIAKQLSAEVAQ